MRGDHRRWPSLGHVPEASEETKPADALIWTSSSSTVRKYISVI